MKDDLLIQLALRFAIISLLSVGGSVAALPEAHRVIVKSVELACSPTRAFSLFTEQAGAWWPADRRHTRDAGGPGWRAASSLPWRCLERSSPRDGERRVRSGRAGRGTPR